MIVSYAIQFTAMFILILILIQLLRWLYQRIRYDMLVRRLLKRSREIEEMRERLYNHLNDVD